MIKISKNLMTETGWELLEDNYDKLQVINSGSVFMTGNGYLGYRGTMAEDTKEDYTGCFVTDTWDKADGKWEELCNVPNALFTKISIDGFPLTLKTEKPESFKRKLDFKNGITSVDYTKNIGKGNKTVYYHEEKFASLGHLHLIPMKIEFSINEDASIKIVEGIDSDVWNLNGNHLKILQLSKKGEKLFVTAETYEKKQLLSVAGRIHLSGLKILNEKTVKNESGIFREIECKLEKDQKAVIHKFMSVYHSNDCQEHLQAALRDVSSGQYEDLRRLNGNKWCEKWQKYDITIRGNLADDMAVRFNTYQSVIATPTHKSLPIGARGLSCQAYQGAAFWDQEIFNLPMYLYTDPTVARNILKYRHDTLDGARRKAKSLGFEGAYYAWISGKTGDELCPDFFFVDVLTGRPIRNHFNDWQIHITPDIVFSFWKYFQITQDYKFMLDYGTEVILESARFLSSRVVYLPKRKRYELWKVQGPDEYHENVENNAFTNYQTKFAFDVTLKLIRILREKHFEQFISILEKIGMNKSELELFEDIAQNIYLPKPDKNGVIEQFDRYFQLEAITPAEKIKSRLIRKDEYYGWPNGIAVFTQAIKQADVIQLISMHPELFSKEIKKSNYEYYEPRTLHFSSLSPSVYAIAAANIGQIEEGLKNFRKSVFIDLKNTNDPISGGTFIGGIHTAAAGAAWQMVVNGFTGIDIRDGKIYIDPQLPVEWEGLNFRIQLNSNLYEITVDSNKIEITLNNSKDIHSIICIKGFEKKLTRGRNTFNRNEDY